MCFRMCVVLLSALCVCTVLGKHREAMADEALAKRFLEEAPRKWKEYETHFLGIDVQGESLTTFPNGTKELTSFRIVLDSNGKQALTESKPGGGKQRETVCVSNQRYKFELSKAPGPNADFAINDVTSNNPKSDDSTLRIGRRIGQWIRLLNMFDLYEIIASPDFSVKDTRVIHRDGKRFVEIEYEYRLTNPSPSQRRLPKTYNGTMLFLPDEYWAMSKATINMPDDPEKMVSRIEIERRIDQTIRDIPAVVETRFRWYDWAGKLSESTEWKYEWKELTDGDSAFTLSAYGFPEPTFSQPSKSRLWFFCITVALLVFCIILFAYRRYHHWQGT